MSDPISINLTDEARAVLAAVKTLPARTLREIAKAIDFENQLSVAHIAAEHLTGQGPFPVEQHRLGVRTNRLRSSLRASEATIEGQSVESGIGSNVIYAAVHEFGVRFIRAGRTGTTRLRTDAKGNLLRQAGHPHLAVFAKSSHSRAKEVAFTSQSHAVEIPARAPITTGIEERTEDYTQAVSKAVLTAWEGRV